MENGSRLRAAAGLAFASALLVGAACSQPATNTNTATTNASTASTANTNVPAATNTSTSPMNTEVALGQEVFESSCSSCHGVDGKGKELFKKSGIPNFTDAAWQKKESDEELLEVIRNGEGPVMPAWKGKLTDEEITAVLQYVRSFPETSGGAATTTNTNAGAKTDS